MTKREAELFLKLQEMAPCDTLQHTIEALHVFEIAVADALVVLALNTGNDQFEAACDNIRVAMAQIITKKATIAS